MAWIFLFFAGVFEVVWAVAMKQSAGFTKLWPTSIMVVGMAVSFFLLAAAMRTLPLGVSYMIWTGIGAVGAFVVGVFFLGEAVTPMRLTAATLIVTGLVVMKLSH